MLKVAIVLIVAFAGLAWSQSPSFGACPTVKTQETVDLKKYLGDWYEIFTFPTTFEKGKCTRARYTLKDNGHVQVYNREIENGKEVNAIGDAYRPNDHDQGKLLVSFAAGAPYTNYWVVHTDYDTYTLVYSCTNIAGLAHIEFAWILARNMTLDASTSLQLKNELASYKVDISKFKTSDQSGCPP